MSVCEHEGACPGYGTAHDAGLTTQERIALGIPLGWDLSRERLKRIMRDARKRQKAASVPPPVIPPAVANAASPVGREEEG